MYAIFNRKTKKFIAFSHSPSTGENTIYRDVGVVDASSQTWCGDFDSGKVATFSEKASIEMYPKPVITESSIDADVGRQIIENGREPWPLYRQINAIVEVLEASDIPKTEKFNRLVECLNRYRNMGSQRKAAFSESKEHVYVKKEEESDFICKKTKELLS